MIIDIIPLSGEELGALPAVQQKLVRTAQKAKNQLEHKMEGELAEFAKLLHAGNMQDSSLYDAKRGELESEYDYQTEILREQLLFNMSLNEPTEGGETGEPGGDESAGYIVDYELSYL